jgi:hypothetical protein
VLDLQGATLLCQRSVSCPWRWRVMAVLPGHVCMLYQLSLPLSGPESLPVHSAVCKLAVTGRLIAAALHWC